MMRKKKQEGSEKGKKKIEREACKDQKLVSADLASLKAKPAKPLMPRNELMSYDRELGSLSILTIKSPIFPRWSTP